MQPIKHRHVFGIALKHLKLLLLLNKILVALINHLEGHYYVENKTIIFLPNYSTFSSQLRTRRSWS
jgi:hypothetical protein